MRLYHLIGKVCRSPMCKYYFQDLVDKKGLSAEIYVDSAATSREEIGNPVHHGTKAKLHQAHIPCEDHQAKQMRKEDYAEYDYLIGMDEQNMRNMKRITGGDPEGKMFKLLEFAGSHYEVADPWYTGDFETTWRDVTAGCDGLLEHILKKK